MKNNGCWIFISHSSADIEKIRIIRNEFEKYGQNPLAFHLKCLSADTTEGAAEIDNLIKREIMAREWFVYCESENAKKSHYVQMERDFVHSCSKKMIWKINLSEDIEKILLQVKNICCSIQVFLSYSHVDMNFANCFANALKEKDYGVWCADNIVDAFDCNFDINNTLKQIIKKGFVCLLLTSNSINSMWIDYEAKFARENGATLILLIFDNVIDYNSAYQKYKTIHIYHIPTIPKEEDIYLIVNLIDKALERKIEKTIDRKANVFNAVSVLQHKLNYAHHYHSQEPIWVANLGALDDYCEVYKFPCCGKHVIMGNGIPSVNRADGCCKKDL